MTNFFQNPNAHSVVVDRVPCSFAKANRDGTPGTHYSLVIFDKNQCVMYVGSECEHRHGEGVQALHEMGGGGNQTCFSVTNQFSAALNAIKTKKGVAISRYDSAPVKDLSGSPILKEIFDVAWSAMRDRHNKRVIQQVQDSFPTFKLKGEFIQSAVRRIGANLLNLAAANSKTTPSAISHATLPRVLSVHERSLMSNHWVQGTELTAGSPRLILTPGDSSDLPLAFRNDDGSWLIDDNAVRRWASRTHNSVPSWSTYFEALKENRSKLGHPDGLCIFCNEEYERMSRHTKGAKHVNRVHQFVGMVCRATTPVGLRMLNHPHHRVVFNRLT